MTTGMEEYLAWGKIIGWSVTGLGIIMTVAALSASVFSPRKDRTFPIAILVGIAFVVLLGGLPIPWNTWSDRDIYAMRFLEMTSQSIFDFSGKDTGFYYLNYILSRFLDVKGFFFALAALYVGNYLVAVKRCVNGDALWLLAACLLSMGFTSYGVNTMRAGLALSIVVMGLTFYRSWVKMGLLFALALTIHFSTAIPIAMIVASKLYNNSKLYFILWCLSVVVSFGAGEYFNHLFQGLSDDGRTGYLAGYDNTYGYKTGFRIDFIIYSFVPMLIGYYYIFKRGFRNTFYSLLFNSYILANIFWVLVIRANFSDRFAYLSWFMIPFVLVYPLLAESRVVRRPGVWLGAIFAGETIFGLLL